MFRILGRLAIAVAIATASPSASAQPSDKSEIFEAIRAADVRLADIGFRLSVAAAPLCDRLEPGVGIQFHTLAQFDPTMRAKARAHFGFVGAVAVEGVTPGSPASSAGIRPNDTLAAINGAPVSPDIPLQATTASLAALHKQFAALPPTTPIDLTLLRDGRQIRVRIEPVPACFSRYELHITSGFDARANGELVQISSRYIEDVEPELMPVVVAHELSHNILRHRERLAAAGATFGLASGFGRNVGLFRQTEIEADILAIHLLARAGYTPSLAVRFWREVGPRLLAGLVRNRSHPALEDRIAIAEAEAARIDMARAAPPPVFIADRSKPLTGEWRRYLPPRPR